MLIYCSGCRTPQQVPQGAPCIRCALCGAVTHVATPPAPGPGPGPRATAPPPARGPPPPRRQPPPPAPPPPARRRSDRFLNFLENSLEVAHHLHGVHYLNTMLNGEHNNNEEDDQDV